LVNVTAFNINLLFEIFWRCLMKLRSLLMFGSLLVAVGLTGCGGGGGGGDSADSGGVTPQDDVVAPLVIATTPTNNSSNVKVNSDITATFSEAIAPATLTPLTCRLIKDTTGATISGYSIEFDESSKTAILSNAVLDSSAAYTVTITTGVKDLAGNPLSSSYSWGFTTAAAAIPGGSSDTTPPAVVSMSPAQNALNVPLESTVVATFSEAVNPNTVNAQTFTLKKNGATAVAGSVSYTGTSALFDPSADLEAGASYSVTLSSGVRDLAGNALADGFTWTFATSAQTDRTPPKVISVSPFNGAQNVPLDSFLIVTFDEAIMPFEFGLLDGSPVIVTFEDNYKKVILDPTNGLKPATTYQARISVKDMAGNWSEPYDWTFITSQ
jgi:hypothetical protein